MKKKNNNWTTVFWFCCFLQECPCCCIRSLSDYWNSMHQTRAIASYAETVSQLDTAQYDEMWKAAQDYNRSLAQRETAFALTDEQKAAYESLLGRFRARRDGLYRNTRDRLLASHLPRHGGVCAAGRGRASRVVEPSRGRGGTHCVLSGHRGFRAQSCLPISISLPSAIRFCCAFWTRS